MLGLDLGEKRIGVAVADADGIAMPLTTLRRAATPAADADAIARLLAEQGATEIVVGLPLEAAGHEGAQARDHARLGRGRPAAARRRRSATVTSA